MNNHSKEFLGHVFVTAVFLIIATIANNAMAQTTGAPVTGKFSGLVYDRATQTFNSVLTLTNTGTVTRQSPIIVVIATSTAAVTVAGTSDGSTYIANLPGGSLAPGASATVVVAFTDPTRVAFTPSITSIVTTDATSVAVIGIAGGTISVTNHLGDVLTLTIPPLALDEDTSISVLALNAPLPNPIATNLYPGAILQPSGLVFSLPVNATVTFHQSVGNSNLALLFYLKNSNFAWPTANQTPTPNNVGGDIYHFSTISVGAPTQNEIQAAANALLQEIVYALKNNLPVPGDPVGDILDVVNALLSLSKLSELAEGYGGNPALALTYYNDALQALEEGSAALLAAPVPSNTCGLEYNVDLQRLSAAITILLGTNSPLISQIAARACTFDVKPDFLFLAPGETWQQGITATLLDPNGVQRSCAVLNWYSANLNVVTIAPTNGNVVFPTAVSPGTANVSGNCDGLLAYSQVEVISQQQVVQQPAWTYILTWTTTANGPPQTTTLDIPRDFTEVLTMQYESSFSGTAQPVLTLMGLFYMSMQQVPLKQFRAKRLIGLPLFRAVS
jgi:hypothetical protein